MKKILLFTITGYLFLSQYLYGFDNIGVPLNPPANGTMLGNCEVYLGKYTAKTIQILLSDFSAQLFPKRTNNAIDNGGSWPSTNISLSGIESSCGITNISNLIIDGANNTFDSDDYFGFKVQGLDPNTNEMTLYEFAFSGETNTTIIATTSPVFDIISPIIILSGSSSISIPFGSTYTEPGVTRTDNVDGSGSIFTGVYGQTGSFQVSGTVNTLLPGVYTIEYQKIDEAGNKSNIVTRTITVGAALATLTPIIDGTIRTSGYTTPARIYHIRTGLNIQITANTNLVKPVVDFSLTGIADDPTNNSLTYRLRFTHPLAGTNPIIAASIASLNGQVAVLDDRSVRTFTGDINPMVLA